ncbi:hypothetical protein [Desulfopila sp. IMCC35008]|uniref:hypothetical protein n=1 Tax=Desulfopila sp. IMCC35008 TaxID=2653858 RepID=UPI0013D8D2F7|nr:hypothetical protein [Desulfopila sp. IMCC35008]
MSSIALLPDDGRSRGLYLDNKILPDNYMADFTLLGFVVDDYQLAVRLLRDNGYRLSKQPGGTDIHFHSPESLIRIRSLLRTHGIGCDISDVADTLYQA